MARRIGGIGSGAAVLSDAVKRLIAIGVGILLVHIVLGVLFPSVYSFLAHLPMFWFGHLVFIGWMWIRGQSFYGDKAVKIILQVIGIILVLGFARQIFNRGSKEAQTAWKEYKSKDSTSKDSATIEWQRALDNPVYVMSKSDSAHCVDFELPVGIDSLRYVVAVLRGGYRVEWDRVQPGLAYAVNNGSTTVEYWPGGPNANIGPSREVGLKALNKKSGTVNLHIFPRFTCTQPVQKIAESDTSKTDTVAVPRPTAPVPLRKPFPRANQNRRF